jgi:MFS family permease
VWRLAVARSLGATGSITVNTAVVYTLYDRTASTAWIAAYFLVTFAGYGVLQPLGGALADRYDRRLLLIAANLGGAASYAALAFVTRPLGIIVIALVSTVLLAPFLPASRAAVPNLVDAGDLTWANGVVARTFSISVVAGPIVGGGLVGPIGARNVLLLAAAMLVVSALLCVGVRGALSSVEEASGDHEGVLAGIAFVAGDRLLRAIVIAEVVAFSGSGFAIVSDAPLAKSFDAGALGYGAMIFVWGIGMVAGSAAAGRIRDPRRELPAMIAGMGIMGLGLALIWPAPSFAPILVLLLLGGVGMGVIEVARQGVMQRRTPDEVRGRVFAAAESVAGMSFAASFVVAGAVVGLVGAQPSYGLAGIAYLVGAAVVCLLVGRDAISAST